MVIFISGSINSGKTTTAKALAQKIGGQFIDIDDVNDRVPNFDLSKDIPKGIALAVEDINELTDEGKSVVVSYPISEKNRQQIIKGLHDKDPQFITLAPHLAKKELKPAEKAYRDAIKKDPGLIEAYKKLIPLLVARKDLRLADVYYQRLVEATNRHAEAVHEYLLFRLAFFSTEDGELKSIQTQLKELIKQNPQKPEFHNTLGITSFQIVGEDGILCMEALLRLARQ